MPTQSRGSYSLGRSAGSSGDEDGGEEQGKNLGPYPDHSVSSPCHLAPSWQASPEDMLPEVVGVTKLVDWRLPHKHG